MRIESTMGRPNVPAAFDPSHASLIDMDSIVPIHADLSKTWSCISINSATPYGDMVKESRRVSNGPSEYTRKMIGSMEGRDGDPVGVKRSAPGQPLLNKRALIV